MFSNYELSDTHSNICQQTNNGFIHYNSALLV